MQNKNAAQKSSNPTLLAGIVVCAHCGAKMSAFLHQRPAVLPAWLSCPLPAAFSSSPLRGHRRVSHADGHAVFKVQQAKRKQKSRHKTDQPCLRFFWKVMLVGYVTAESQNVQPRRARTNM
ncbi:MAG: zinc ribbon domain-containing protein [Subdoligranulum sp.]